MRGHFITLFSRISLVVALLAVLVGSAVHVTPVRAASIVVNSNADNRANDGKCTLREAIIAATGNIPSGNMSGECAAGSSGTVVDTISFAGNYTITVGSQLPFVTTPIKITGRGAANTIIQAAASPNVATWRLFQVTPTGNLTLDGVTVRNGRCNGSCTVVGDVEPNTGGGIYNSGTLTVTHSTIAGNTATGGGGIVNWDTLTVTNSTFSGNTANGEFGLGGAVYSDGEQALTVTNSTFSRNTATYGGGGIFSSWITNVMSSTFSGNSTSEGNGGGIYNVGLMNLANSTFSGNSAAFGTGGGLYNYVTDNLTVTNSTFAGNSAVSGGGIGTFGGIATLKNTIVANNSGGNCSGTGIISNSGNNLDDGTGCGWGSNDGSMSNTNPMLGPLANNGGPTRTMALLAGSPAIDAGSDTNCEDTDQRGGARPQGSHCDIGAYEFGATVVIIPAFSDVPLSYWAWNFIERLYDVGITGGCVPSPLQYCPETTVTRAQMAVFLERGIHGSSYNPPAVGSSTGFGDVPTTYWAAAWIKQLRTEGITGGCVAGLYCPEGAVTRAQMAVFLLRSKYGASYNPPAVGNSTGFTDVPPTYWAAAWIKQLVAEGITSGCGTGSYCPESPVTRAQMAVFLVRTFSLP